jgi:hypothetical protein
MPGKKAHTPRDAGNPGKLAKSSQARKSSGQTDGQYTRDPKGRKGQYTAAGDSPLIKK